MRKAKQITVRCWSLNEEGTSLEEEYTLGKDGSAVPSFETIVTRRQAEAGERFFDVNVAKILKREYPQFQNVVIERDEIYYPKDGLKFMLAIAANYSFLKRPCYSWSEVVEYEVRPPVVPKVKVATQESCMAGWCGTTHKKRMTVRGRRI